MCAFRYTSLNFRQIYDNESRGISTQTIPREIFGRIQVGPWNAFRANLSSRRKLYSVPNYVRAVLSHRRKRAETIVMRRRDISRQISSALNALYEKKKKEKHNIRNTIILNECAASRMRAKRRILNVLAGSKAYNCIRIREYLFNSVFIPRARECKHASLFQSFAAAWKFHEPQRFNWAQRRVTTMRLRMSNRIARAPYLCTHRDRCRCVRHANISRCMRNDVYYDERSDRSALTC